MEKIMNTSSAIIGIAGGFLVLIFGGWDTMLCVLVTLMVIDYVSGVLKAVYTKELSSYIGFRGIIKKVMTLLVVAAAHSIERGIGTGIGLREMVITFFAANEGISILENAAVLLPDMPKKLKDILLQIRDSGGDDK